MISWRTSRIFLLYLASLALFVVMLFGVGNVPHFQPSPSATAGKPVLRPLVNPVLVIPKDAPSIFEEV